MHDLIEGINKKREDAFRVFFTEHFSSVAMFANRYVQHLEIAADLAQEGFLRLWSSNGRFESVAAVKGFLYRTVRNMALDHLKHSEVESKYLKRRNQAGVPDQIDIMEEEIYRMLHQAIYSLPPQSRRVMLYAIDGMSNPEIAEKLGVSVNTVRTLKQNSHRKMKVMLREYYYIFF